MAGVAFAPRYWKNPRAYSAAYRSKIATTDAAVHTMSFASNGSHLISQIAGLQGVNRYRKERIRMAYETIFITTETFSNFRIAAL